MQEADMYEFIIAEPKHYDDYYKIKAEPNHIYWSGFDSPPNYLTFRKHYEKLLNDESKIIILLYIDSKITGYVSIDILSTNDKVETSRGVLESYRGKGLGQKLTAYAIQYTKDNLPNINSMISWVAENNIASMKGIIDNGYTLTDEFEYRKFKLEKEPVKFHKYQLILK